MRTVRISPDGICSDTGEQLPDRNLLMHERAAQANRACESCGQTICSVPGCQASEAALARLTARWDSITSWREKCDAVSTELMDKRLKH